MRYYDGDTYDGGWRDDMVSTARNIIDKQLG